MLIILNNNVIINTYRYQIQKLTKIHTIEKNGPNISSIEYEEFKQCVIMHYKCLQSVPII